jgi:hypothetical protein
VLPYTLCDVDADLRAGTRTVHGLVLELQPIHMLVEVRGVALEVQATRLGRPAAMPPGGGAVVASGGARVTGAAIRMGFGC